MPHSTLVRTTGAAGCDCGAVDAAALATSMNSELPVFAVSHVTYHTLGSIFQIRFTQHDEETTIASLFPIPSTTKAP